MLGLLGRLAVLDLHLELPLIHAQHERLRAHPAHHVKRLLGLAIQGQLLRVFLNPRFDHLSKLLGDLEKPIRRAHPVQSLVGPLVVVILEPVAHPLLRVLEAAKLRTHQEFVPDRLPEALHLAQGHRMVRAAHQVMDLVFGQFHLEARLPSPVGVLTALVGEHLLGASILPDRPAVDLQDILGCLAAIQPQPHHVSGVIVDKADQVGIAPAQAEGADIALPELVGGAALEKARLGRIAGGLLLRPGHQALLVEHLAHRFRARLEKQHPPHPLADALDPRIGLLLLDFNDLRMKTLARRQGRLLHPVAFLEAFLTLPPVATDPLAHRPRVDPELLTDQCTRQPFFEEELDGLELDRGGYELWMALGREALLLRLLRSRHVTLLDRFPLNLLFRSVTLFSTKSGLMISGVHTPQPGPGPHGERQPPGE